MKILRYTWFWLVCIVLVSAGCATGPKLTKDDVLSQNEQIAKLDSGLKDAAAQDINNLAPENFKTATAKFNEAVSEAIAGRTGTADSAAAAGLAALDTANQDAATSRDLMREVLAAREEAYKTGAASSFPEKTADLDAELRKATGYIERGKLDDAKDARHDLLTGYEQLELKSLQEGTVKAAQEAIASAKKNDAARYAPKTFKLAEEEMSLAQSVLAADRTQTEKANSHSRRAKFLAEQSIYMTEKIRDFDRRNYTLEDAVLWYQKQLSEINSPLCT